MDSLPVRIVFMALALLLLPVLAVRSYQLEAVSVQREVTLEARERLTPNLIEPPVRFAIRNRDPQTGSFYTLDVGTLDDVSSWQIQIFNRSRRKVGAIQGRDTPPSLVFWSGVAENGEPLPDGFYDATFGWRDSRKHIHTTKPVSFSLFTPLELRGLADWKLKFTYTDEGLEVSVAENTIFAPGQSEIQNAALPSMLQIALFLKTCPKNMVTVKGYTDSSGSPQRNLMLSRERANRVYQYFIDAGISPGRLTYEGMGTTRAVAPNTTETGRAQNRRVEVVILKTTI